MRRQRQREVGQAADVGSWEPGARVLEELHWHEWLWLPRFARDANRSYQLLATSSARDDTPSPSPGAAIGIASRHECPASSRRCLGVPYGWQTTQAYAPLVA